MNDDGIVREKPVVQRKRRRIYETLETEELDTPVQNSPEESPESLHETVQSDRGVDGIIMKHVIAGMTIAVVPLPLFDIAALTVVQVRMVKQLSEFYQIPFSESRGTSFVTALIGSFAPISGGYLLLGSIFKSIPLVGHLVGGASLSCFAGASTYAVGKVFEQHFESGGTFLNFDPAAVEDHFKAQFDQGKLIASKSKDRKK